MAKRTTKIISGIEYTPEHKARTSKIIANVEYNPEHKARTSKICLMVEYIQYPLSNRVNGPAVQSI